MKKCFSISMAVLWGIVFSQAMQSAALGICMGVFMGIAFGLFDSGRCFTSAANVYRKKEKEEKLERMDNR